MLLKNYSLNALRVFAVAANAGSFKHAAQQLDLSQSAITRHIQTLEEQLGTKLFHRDNRVHALTPVGEALGQRLLPLFQRLEQSVQSARSSGDEELTTLRLLVPASFLRWWLAARLADFTAIYPHIRIQLDTYDEAAGAPQHAAIAQALQQGTLDLAMIHGRIKDRSLKQQRLYQPTFSPISSATSERDTLTPCWVDPLSESWQQLMQGYPEFAKSQRLQPVAKNSIGLELVTSAPGSTLIDSLYAAHPQFSGLRLHSDIRVVSKTDVLLAMKQAARHPVAVVAFSKWLQNRLQQSL
ncbi:LysR family transcriptional regulator [Pseudidiomarina insulisalsae]|uniref:HTH lysR-type domain-containing protein n=1 Tax=Pseudidiomarina insulisalsae TaxID=575789 RepID=A0A432YH80_9GAMM|nr:LysR family transcriptional regulator [Pseudidiomarina insulisalsae]RUO60280.1 hypothetical protein CWI71_07690 [Pseudidiomarina insulisalsae]